MEIIRVYIERFIITYNTYHEILIRYKYFALVDLTVIMTCKKQNNLIGMPEVNFTNNTIVHQDVF